MALSVLSTHELDHPITPIEASIPESLDHLIPTTLPSPSRLARTGTFIRSNWDRGFFILKPKLGSSTALIGALLYFGGLTLFCTSPFIKIDPSLSFMFSLVLMRSGLHFIDSGVRLSRSKLRTYQETVREYRLFAIKFRLDPTMAENERIAGMKEILRMNARLDPAMQIFDPTIKENSTPEHFFSHFKEMPDPVPGGRVIPFAQKMLPKVGAADVMLGILTFTVALVGLAFLVSPKLLPGTVIKEDPYLSFAFISILAANSITCIYTGSQMINYDKREKKRERLNEQLKQIQRGLEDQEVIELPAPPTLRNNWFTRTGKKLTPFLSEASLFMGITLIALSVLYAIVSSGRPIPKVLDKLIKGNTSITPHFATGIGLLGLSAIYKGISLMEKKVKGKWKDKTENLSQAIIGLSKGKSVTQEEVNRLLAPKAKDKRCFGRPVSLLNRFTLIPHAIGGAALIYFGAASLGKISNVTSFVFSATLIVMGIDAFTGNRGAYQVLTYNKRKKEDADRVTLLQNVLSHESTFTI